MAWRYQYNPDLKIIEATYSGSTSARDLQESTSEFIRIEHEKGINRFLVDTTRMELDATLLDVHDLPAKQYEAEAADRNGKLALILSDSRFERQAGEFYRDSCRNRGYDVETFDDRQHAMSWLVGGAQP